MKSKIPEIGKAILEAIQEQIQNNEPPETKQTYERLMREIKNHDEVMKYLGSVLSAEIYDVLSTQKPYNNARYIQRLQRLPDLSWMK